MLAFRAQLLFKRNLRRTTILSSISFLGAGLISAMTITGARADNCSGSGGIYTCSGTINTPPSFSAVSNTLNVTLNGTVSNTSNALNSYTDSSGVVNTYLFSLWGGGSGTNTNITYSGGAVGSQLQIINPNTNANIIGATTYGTGSIDVTNISNLTLSGATGPYSSLINIYSEGDGSLTATNNGQLTAYDISTQGFGAITANQTSGPATIINNGNINAYNLSNYGTESINGHIGTGIYASGMNINSHGNAFITNSGTVEMSSSDINSSGWTVNMVNGGNILTDGSSLSTNNGNINIHSGGANSSDSLAQTYATGIGGGTEVSNPNTTSTISVINAANSTINTSTGDVSGVGNAQTFSWGISSIGIFYGSSATNGANTLVTNDGTISTISGNATSPLDDGISGSGSSAWGVFSTTTKGNATLINTGLISATSQNATGYNAWSQAIGEFGLSSNGIINITNAGDISTFGGQVISPNPQAISVSAGIVAAPIIGYGNGTKDSPVDKFITNSGSITSNGSATYGILAGGDAGFVSITNTTTGNIQSLGTTGAGIYASTTNNIISITNYGLINSLNGSAISARNINTGTGASTCANSDTCSTTINNYGTLIGSGLTRETATIVIDPNKEGNSATTTVTNNGLITNQAGSLDNWAITVGSPVNTTLRVINNGTIIGKVEQYQNGAAVTNNSVWNTTGTNNFLGGQNSITNTAGSLIQSNGDTTVVMDGTGNQITNAGTIRTVGGKLTLDPPNNAVTVYNSGLIDMVNDGSSSIANVVQIDGNFVASGNSAVAVNTQLGGAGSQSDRLLIAGNASGTNTNIIVKDTKGGVGAYNPFGTAIVGYGGTSTGGFTLSADSDHFAFRNGMSTLNKGLYFYYIGQGTSSTGCDAGYTCYSLYSAPSTAAKSLPIAVTAAQSLWQETALMWEDRQVELRDELTTRAYAAGNDQSVSRNNVRYNTALKPQDGGISTWIKSVGAWTNRNNNQTQWGGGGNALSYDLSYRQNSLGMLGGADWSKAGFLTPKDYLVVGVMGGYLNSSVNFNQEAGNVLGQENFTYQGGTVGGSISYMLNGFFADALFKNDMLRSNMKIPVIGLTGSTTGVNTAGGVGNLGYRLNYGSMFFEPMATLTYSNTYMGGLNNLAASGVNVSFGPGNDFRGGFGGRIGSNFGNIVSNHMLELSLTGRYWNMFNSNAGRTATIVSDFTPDTIGDYTLGRDYGEIKGNVNVFSLGSGVSAFINTGVRFNDHFQTVITKGGLAYRF